MIHILFTHYLSWKSIVNSVSLSVCLCLCPYILCIQKLGIIIQQHQTWLLINCLIAEYGYLGFLVVTVKGKQILILIMIYKSHSPPRTVRSRWPRCPLACFIALYRFRRSYRAPTGIYQSAWCYACLIALSHFMHVLLHHHIYACLIALWRVIFDMSCTSYVLSGQTATSTAWYPVPDLHLRHPR